MHRNLPSSVEMMGANRASENVVMHGREKEDSMHEKLRIMENIPTELTNYPVPAQVVRLINISLVPAQTVLGRYQPILNVTKFHLEYFFLGT